jgi:hypothetical protein
MRATRVSIGSLLAVIGIFGVALAALRNPSYLWANAAFTTALAAVMAAVVNTVFGRGSRRAYWIGFALFGGIYLSICSMPALRDSVCPRLVTEAILDVVYALMAPDAPQASASFTITAMVNGGPVVLSPALGVPAPMPAPPVPPIALSARVGSGPTQNSAPALPMPALPPLMIPPPPPQPDPWTAWTAPDRSIVYGIGSIAHASSEAFRQIGHSLTALLVATLGGVFARHRYHAYARDAHPPEPALQAPRETSTTHTAS